MTTVHKRHRQTDWHHGISASALKTGPDQENSRKYFPFGEKIVKIGPVDTDIKELIVKKEENI